MLNAIGREPEEPSVSDLEAPKQATDINKELDRLEKQVKFLTQAITGLEKKVSPVLASVSKEQAEGEKDEVSPATELGKEIRGYSSRFQKEADRLDDIIKRIDL